MAKFKLWMLAAILAVSGMAKIEAQDIATKKAAPKARVINIKGATADRQAQARWATLQGQSASVQTPSVQKTHTPGIAFRDALTMTQPKQTLVKDQPRVPLRHNGRKAVRPYAFSTMQIPQKAYVPAGEVTNEYGIITSPAAGVHKVYSRSGRAYTVPQNYDDTDAADHWMISPELPGMEQEISFYLRVITDQYGGESFEVLGSTTDNQPDNFTLLESFTTVEEAWTPFYVTLPEGTKYFAIRHTSNDVFGIMVDDVTFNYAGSVDSYNVYCDGVLVATVEDGVTTYTVAVEDLTQGEHTFAVTAVYASGQESMPAAVSFNVVTAIRQLMADGQPVDVYGLDGKLVRSEAKSLDGLKGVYVINGSAVIIK